ncbi:MAG: hypothetical protein WCO19_00125 [Candidatus Saccharibacteria bacterium]
MSELYLTRNQYTSCVVIEQRAADAVDETFVKMLTRTAMIDVEGSRLILSDLLRVNATTGRHERNPEPTTYRVEQLQQGIARMAMSLRWNEGNSAMPRELQQGFPVLCLRENQYDRYVDAIVLPELGFHASENDFVQLSQEERYQRLPDTLKPTFRFDLTENTL